MLVAVIAVPANVFAVGEGDDDNEDRDAEHIAWCQSQDLSDPETRTWTVHFNTFGGTAIPDTVAVAGCSLESMGKPPVDAEKENNTFFGWYHEENFTQKYYSGFIPDNDTITDVDLYAQFAPNDMIINTAEIWVNEPIAGREITVTVITDDGAVIEMQEPIPEVYVEEENFHVGYAGWRTTDDEVFEGTFVKGQQYKVSVELISEDDYRFSPTFTATINGEVAEIEEYNSYSDGTWVATYTLLEAVEGETYTVSNEAGETITFVDGAEHDFEYFGVQFASLSMTPAELEEIGMDEETYNIGKNLIIDAVGDKGETLAYLEINVCEAEPHEDDEVPPYCAHEGPFTARIKIPEGMTGYNIYKVMYMDVNIDEDGASVETGDLIICDKDGDYITCVLPHLSGYALIGSNESAPNTGIVTNTHETISESIILAVTSATVFVFAGFFIITSKSRR